MDKLLHSNETVLDEDGVNFVYLNTIDLVKEFYIKYNIPYRSYCINIEDDDLNKFIVDFLQEELDELKQALKEKNPVKVLDALTDLQYVLDGTFLSFGLGRLKNKAFREVHRSNMTKVTLHPGKPSKYYSLGYKPPNLDKLFRIHCEYTLKKQNFNSLLYIYKETDEPEYKIGDVFWFRQNPISKKEKYIVTGIKKLFDIKDEI